jgi:hypothetical protein
MYSKEEKLKLYKPVWITEKEYKTLREQKKKQGISLAKLACNAIIEKYGL